MFTTIGRGARGALGSKLMVAVTAGAFGFGVAGTAAYASIPDVNGVINACYSGTGSLRVIDTAARPPRNSCFGTETALSWTAQGAPGPPGPAGAAGPPGPRGPAGAPGSSPSLTFYSKASTSGTVGCDGSDIVISGGASATLPLVQSVPTFFFGKVDGWIARDVEGNGPFVRVICARQN